MKIRVGGKTKNYRTVWFENRSVKLIDQTKLPFKFSIYSAKTYKQTREAIRNMIVRGAPAIGATAAFATAQAALEFKGKDLKKFFAYMQSAAKFIKSARPTAIDLAHAVDRVLNITKNALSIRAAQ